MKKKVKVIFLLCIIFINIITGYFTYLYFTQEPKIEIIEKTAIKETTKVSYDYKQLDLRTCKKELKNFATKKPFLDGKMRSENIFYVEAGLNGRTWNREFKLKVHEQGNWKFYIASVAVGAAAGGYIIYKMMR